MMAAVGPIPARPPSPNHRTFAAGTHVFGRETVP